MTPPTNVVVLLTSLALCGPGIGLTAQSTTELFGHVTDAQDVPLPGAAVSVEGSRLGVATDRHGAFRLLILAPGPYRVVFEALGYERRTIEVEAGPGATRVDAVLGVEPIRLQGLTVEGQRLGQAMAMNQQRAADNLRTVVAAEHIGRFPDPNAAEALQRLPGVSVRRDQGEGRFVLIRGAEPRLNAISINGVRLPSPDGNVRSVALDVVPSDVLGSIEVHKSLTPDMDADAVGGTVNLVTRSAPRGYDLLDVTLAGGFNALTANDIGQFAGSLARRFGASRRMSVVLAGSYYKTDRGADNVEMEWGEAFDAPVPEELELRDYQVFRERIGLTGALEYTLPDERSSLRVTGIFSDFSDQEFRRRSRIRFGKGDYVSSTSVVDGAMERELKDRLEIQRIWSLAVGGSQALGRAVLDYGVSVAHAGEREPERSDIAFAQEEMGFDFDVSDPWRPRYTVTGGSEFDGQAFAFEEWIFEDNSTTDDDVVGTVDLSWPFASASASGSLKVGAKVRLKDKKRTNDVRIYDGFDGDLALEALAGSFEDDDFFFDRYRIGRFPDPGRARSFTHDNLGSFELDDAASRADTDPGNYAAEEDVYAAYVMSSLDLGKLRLVPGVRVERTALEYAGNEVLFDEDGEYVSTLRTSERQTRSHVLPGINLRYALSPLTQLRAGVTRSLARPDYYDLVPYRLVNREDEEVELGNHLLEVTSSTNLDLTLERYSDAIGVVSGGLFYKALSGYVFRSRAEIEGGELDGFESLQPRNTGPGHLWGVELGWSQQLADLPSPLDGLGVHLNYTFADSEADIPGRDGGSVLPGQARHVGNVALGYDKYGVTTRLAVHFHGRYVEEIGDAPEEDVYYGSRTQIDMTAAYQLTSAAQLFLELVNVTNEPLRFYLGDERRPIQQEYYSWWGHIGVKLRGF